MSDGNTTMEWVPLDACTLPTAEQPLRVAEFDELFATALTGVDRLALTRLRLTFDSATVEAEAGLRDLVARETQCCSFFGFGVDRVAPDRLCLDVEVPATRAGEVVPSLVEVEVAVPRLRLSSRVPYRELGSYVASFPVQDHPIDVAPRMVRPAFPGFVEGNRLCPDAELLDGFHDVGLF